MNCQSCETRPATRTVVGHGYCAPGRGWTADVVRACEPCAWQAQKLGLAAAVVETG